MTAENYFDLGVVNVNGSTSSRGLRMRSATLNIGNGATYTTTGSHSSIGLDSGENATVNLSGSAKLLASNNDFNISDNANSTGTLNVRDTAELRVGGAFFVGKSSGATGSINQSGGTVNANKTGGNSLSIGQRHDGAGPNTGTGPASTRRPGAR